MAEYKSLMQTVSSYRGYVWSQSVVFHVSEGAHLDELGSLWLKEDLKPNMSDYDDDTGVKL